MIAVQLLAETMTYVAEQHNMLQVPTCQQNRMLVYHYEYHFM
jgi:hypothetical protein